MCLAVPGRIKSIDKLWAIVDIMGIETTVNIQLIDAPEIDDHILIHAGCAIQKVNKAYLSYLEQILEELMVEDNGKNG